MLGFDHIGHGKSDGQRGHIPSLDAHLDNVDRILEEAAERFPGIPRFVFGHSMGGSLAINHAIRRTPDLAGLVVSAPWLRLSQTLPTIRFSFMKLMNLVWPSFSISRGSDPSKLTRDEEVATACWDDPLNHGRISARQLIVALKSGAWAMENAPRFTHPLLMVHGDADQVTCPQASEQFADITRGECEFRLLAGFRHEPHNEPEREQVIQSYIRWVAGRLKT